MGSVGTCGKTRMFRIMATAIVDLLLRPGMTLAIEPMLNVGGDETLTLDDGWTVITKDRTLSAHFEHTVVITDGEPEILTKRLASVVH